MKKRKWLLQLSAQNCDTSQILQWQRPQQQQKLFCHSKTQHTCGRAFFCCFYYYYYYYFLNQTKGGESTQQNENSTP